MAFTEFYIDQASGASDLNAGTTSANVGGGSSAAAFTYAGGTFVRATGVFTVASGNPQTDGVTVGTYASVYTTSGAVAATFVAQITARNTTTVTLDVTTLKWGVATSVSEGAAASTLKVSGAWTSEIVLAATGLGTFTVPTTTSMRVNIKQATYTVVASRTISIAGATTTPVWFRGYNTTPGDCDSNPALARPTLALNATFLITAGGVHNIFSSINTTGNRSGSIFTSSANTHQHMVRMRWENTSSNAAAVAYTGANGVKVAYCWAKCPTTATTTGVISVPTNGQVYVGTIAEGGGIAGFSVLGSNANFLQCIALNNTGFGLSLTTSTSFFWFNGTIYNATSDGIRFTTPASITQIAAVVGSLFSNCGTGGTGYGINNSSGTNTNLIFRACNDFYSCTTGNENGFGDSPSFFERNEVASPIVGATDLSLAVGALARQTGYAPGGVENETYTSYMSIGAVQPTSASSAAGIIGDGSTW